MNELGLLIGCIFIFGFGAFFLMYGHNNVIEGLTGWKDFFADSAHAGKPKLQILAEFLVLLGIYFLFASLWISSFFIVPWALLTMAKQAEPLGLLVAIALFGWLLYSIWQEVHKKLKRA